MIQSRRVVYTVWDPVYVAGHRYTKKQCDPPALYTALECSHCLVRLYCACIQPNLNAALSQPPPTLYVRCY